jgi:glutamate-5-semialdehyde dehydrogenase
MLDTPAMSTLETSREELGTYCRQVASRSRTAGLELSQLATAVKNRWLLASAEAILDNAAAIFAANADDLADSKKNGLTDAEIDRLRLDPKTLEGISQSLREIAALRDPIGETIEGWIQPNGLEIQKRRVPIGSIFFIYESRPNVTVDAAGLCVKSGNSVILRGGKEAFRSSAALTDILQKTGQDMGLPDHCIQLVETSEREAVGHFLRLNEFIDVVIPRGGKGLIERVVREATMPVIKHYDGNCHVYIDADADIEMAIAIVVNSKCQRMGVCNACESLLIHQNIASLVLPALTEILQSKGVEIRGDSRTRQIVPSAIAATEQDWATEYLGPIISVCVVDDLHSAIGHINQYGSHHTDAIVTGNLDSARKFQMAVDSGVVIVNASTRFNDGGQFGLGAEIGISTDKLHARGPCGLRELTTYKYIVSGTGQLR